MYDENGRVWCEECISARFIRPVEEAARVALKNADWDPFPSKGSKVKKVSTGPPRPSTLAVAVLRVTALPQLEQRSRLRPRPQLPGRRSWWGRGRPWRTGSCRPLLLFGRVPLLRGREAPSTKAAPAEVAPTGNVAVETAAPKPPRKRALFVFLEGEDEEEAPPVIVSEAPLVADEVVVEEEAMAKVPNVEEAAAAEMVVEEVVEEAATTEEVVEMLDAATASAEVPAAEEAAEEAAADVPDDEAIVMEQTRTAPVEVISAASVVPSMAAATSAELLPSSPSCPSGIMFRSELYASLHEEGGSSTSAPLDEDSKTVVERLREFLFLGVHQMTATEAFMEFRSCLDRAMALGLLNSAQLDELKARLAEGEDMIGRYAEAVMRMVEGSSLEQELVEIKEQVRLAMARLKENDLVIQRENEELAQVEA
ncbi:uncharacterized protein Pyn_07209 [Prunus yedoensis var. nudiflora]|uniref:Uncharacterized protein n=1 Tax=Prunus yedoensis var. nudiflora TaxID=2094558 RepID=A0A314URH5_PRUYE|nr:uncharacterized protein Pyn_07209 [Prunus yedoensis var. nudiflora]